MKRRKTICRVQPKRGLPKATVAAGAISRVRVGSMKKPILALRSALIFGCGESGWEAGFDKNSNCKSLMQRQPHPTI